jgi:multicomponent Na+:H+ antiporter subunit D
MWLAPLPVALPLACAALLLLIGRHLPARLPDAVATAAAAATAAICALLLIRAAEAPIVYWYGGWTPRGGAARGIDFVIDAAGAGAASFLSLLFTATFVFAWGYFADVGARFHILMLVFLAAMCGFCLTGDIFNLFVFFELMSVTAFALTGYKLEASALEGALNFTVTNSLSFLLLGGIALLYGRTGALNLAQIGRALAAGGADPLVTMALVLVVCGLLVKAAIVPFHFWLADAHAVAPTPVCVIFSGIMVGLGLFGVARLYWTVFSGVSGIAEILRILLLAAGVVTALVGGFAALAQRHMKRLLAFSTIAHSGIVLVGIALLAPRGLAGALLYLAGHGLAKAALFMGVGILLSICGDVDEIRLRGAARHLPLTGGLFAIGGLLLAGLPLGTADTGRMLIDAAAKAAGLSWLPWLLSLAAALTGAAVLRIWGRVFLGWGPDAGEEERRSPTERSEEKPGRPVWLMLAPAGILLGAALLCGGTAIEHAGRIAAAIFADRAGYARLVLDGTHPAPPAAIAAMPPDHESAWLAVALAIALAGFELGRDRLPRPVLAVVDRLLRPPLAAIRLWHSGLIGDYVAWMMVGLAVFGASFAWRLG